MTDAIRSSTDKITQEAVHLLDLVFPGPRNYDIRLWNGVLLAADRGPDYCLVLRHPGALRRMLTPPLEKSIGESYIFGDFDIEGDLLTGVALGETLLQQKFSPEKALDLATGLLRLPAGGATRPTGRGTAQLSGSKHSQARDLQAIQYHYDVGNDFYALWLGKQMLYSCAYFKTGAEDLDTAQADKLEHICRKLRLKPGERLLDIGCGWGGLLIHAAEHFGVHGVGVTLSKEQHSYASHLVQQRGLAGQVEIRLQDYRAISDGPFDKIASVGMVEHVGRQRLPDYFAQAFRLLKPGGLFLNHGISCLPDPSRSLWEKFVVNSIIGVNSFDRYYFFPDGELEPVSELNLAAEKAGLEVRDVENLREHYALTLRRWVQNMAAAHAEMVRITNEVTYRTWRMYMAFMAHSFGKGFLGIHQSLLARPDQGKTGLPNTRADLYREP